MEETSMKKGDEERNAHEGEEEKNTNKTREKNVNECVLMKKMSVVEGDECR